MSFGSSNPPWQRNIIGNAGQQAPMPNIQPQILNPNLVNFQNFNQGLSMAQHQGGAPQNNLTIIPSLSSLNTPSLFNQPLQYPNPRSNLNPNQFSGQVSAQQHQHHSHQQTQQQQIQQQLHAPHNTGNIPPPQMCNKIGVITKFQSNYGFVDDEVLFHKGSCKGFSPKIGDKVIVEATYCSSTFKWNATNIQLAQNSNSRNQSTNQPRNISNPISPNIYTSNIQIRNSRNSPAGLKRSPDRNGRTTASTSSHSKNKDDDDIEENRKRRERERARDREKERQRDKRDQSSERRDRSPYRKLSPKRKARAIPRYLIQMPKYSLVLSEADILELRRRYSNLYIPSDFFHTIICWSESFPADAPYSLQRPCAFHIFHKTVDQVLENDAILEPDDADYSFSAKVMLLGMPPITEIYKKCFATAEEKERDDLVHPTRLISFLVGLQGRNEIMAIGGPWSPSLDGTNPEGDPAVLIRTAIRTCKSLTGLDLSGCTQWYRFVEFYYKRSETVRKGRTIPARIETVVIYLPDVQSCLPTRIEWDDLNIKYKQQLDYVLKKIQTGTEIDDTSIGCNNSSSTINKTDADVKSVMDLDSGSNQNQLDVKSADDESNQEKTTVNEENSTDAAAFHEDTDMKTETISEQKPEGTNEEALAKSDENNTSKENNGNTGTNQIDFHEENVNSHDGMDIDMNDIVVIDEYDSTKNDGKLSERKKNEAKLDNEREMRYLEKRYRLPENPHILIHPSKTTKIDKFTCEMMSLSILLDYRPEDTKKHSFEVSLFAELFNEMLTRDFGFNIYKAFYLAPDEQNSEKEGEKSKRDKDDSIKSGNDEPKEKKPRKDTETSTSGEKESKDNTSNAEDNQSESGRKSNKETLNRSKDKGGNKEREKEKEHKERDGRDRERDRDRKERRISRRDEDTDDDNYSVRSGDGRRREHKKLRTVDPDLLLSFVYFDQGHCGYIFSNHIEDLFYALGLQLSRAEVKKLVAKLTPRTLLYRKLTDKPIEEAIKEQNEVNNDVNNKAESNNSEIGKGNTALLPVFQDNKNTVNTSPSTNETNEEKSELIMYKGALIDIEKMMNQMKRSEAARANIEQRLVEITKNNQELELNNAKTKEKLKDMQSDLKSTNRKLHDAEQNLSNITRKNSEYYSILLSIHDKVTPAVVKNEQRTRDRKDNRDRDEKDKNNDKDASKDSKSSEKHRNDSKEPETIKKKDVKTETKEED